jgi:hypothetical protein
MKQIQNKESDIVTILLEGQSAWNIHISNKWEIGDVTEGGEWTLNWHRSKQNVFWGTKRSKNWEILYFPKHVTERSQSA